jgi:Ni/Co efflux regulator RcnB
MRQALLAGALIAATLAPVIAEAQPYPHDRREMQENRRDIREDRRDLRQDRREFQRDRRDNWHAPFAYRSFGVGAIVPRAYFGSSYYANDWQRFHVAAPRYSYYRYVRHYGDLLLINTRNGRVVQAYRGYYR